MKLSYVRSGQVEVDGFNLIDAIDSIRLRRLFVPFYSFPAL